MKNLKLFVGALLVALVLIFAIQNAANVDLRFLFWSIQFPRSLLIFLVLLIGIVAGWIWRSTVRK